MQQTDPLDETKTLVRAAQAGDQAAFGRLIEKHYDQIFRFAMSYSGHQADAEDITQQACLKLAKSIGQFRFESAFSTWLYRLVINCAKDWFRKPAATQNIAQDSSEAMGEDEPVIASAEGEVQIHLQQVLAQVATLGEGFRETVILVLAEGLSHKEAGDVLGVKESTVSWRLHETKKRLSALEVRS